MVEKANLQTDESFEEKANNPSFQGMASINSTESDQEVSTSPTSNNFESLCSKLNKNLASFDIIHTDLTKRLTFF